MTHCPMSCLLTPHRAQFTENTSDLRLRRDLVFGKQINLPSLSESFEYYWRLVYNTFLCSSKFSCHLSDSLLYLQCDISQTTAISHCKTPQSKLESVICQDQGCPTFSHQGPVCNFQLGLRATIFFLFLKSIFKIHKTSAGYMYYNYISDG